MERRPARVRALRCPARTTSIGSIIGGESEERRRRLLGELKGLFGIAFGPGVEAYGRSFAERISQDEGFRAEARDRFERGKAWGGFPELSALLSGRSNEEQDEFFEAGWTRVALPSPGSSKDPWDRAPWEGDVEAYREGLYGRAKEGEPEPRRMLA